MRQERTVQASIFDLFADHEIGRELKAMSQWLDEHREIIGLVAEDLRRHGVKETGRQGLPAESVLRCALLKQHRQLSYEELAFHLEDSARFAPSPVCRCRGRRRSRCCRRRPAPSGPRRGKRSITSLLVSARQAKVETGKVVRLDSTVTAALLHEPSDSSLLWDAVRVMVRLLRVADTLIGDRLVWRDHRRAAKKRARVIEYARARSNRVPHYRELIKLTRATLAYADQAAAQLSQTPDPATAPWQAEFRHYRPLIERIIRQTERCVLDGETVAANEKIVSLFEPHTDIIVKGSRQVEYGHCFGQKPRW
jgi:IS5 family transposase